MSQSKLISVLKRVVAEEVRKVIKEELSEILQEGLQSTINEINTESGISQSLNELDQNIYRNNKRAVNFKENKFANILNNTDAIREQTPDVINSYADLMSEDINMTSADALNFGAGRKLMQANMKTLDVITDPETGKNMQVDPAVAKAMTRDYSALMAAIDKKKNR